jgi:hypothetical protein
MSASVTVTITGTVGNEAIEGAQSLKAWTQNGILHVSGLTVGKPWSVYNISGVLVYHGLADSDEADVSLPVRGMYIVTSGNRAVKAVY